MAHDPNDPNSSAPLFTPETEKLVRQMLKDGKAGPKFLRLLKEANPDAAIPAVDLEDKIAAIKAEADKKVDEVSHKFDSLNASVNRAMELEGLRKRGLSQEDIDALEKFKSEKGITDYKIAADAFLYARQLASPTPQINTQRKPMTGDVPKEIMEAVGKGDMSGLDQWARDGAYADINAAKQAQANSR